MNKVDKRYRKNIKIPVWVLLETIFNSDNKDVELLCIWAKKYGYLDITMKNNVEYYRLQDDYKKQSLYTIVSREEVKQHEYEDYLCNENDELLERIDKAVEYIENHTCWELSSSKLLDILKGDSNE